MRVHTNTLIRGRRLVHVDQNGKYEWVSEPSLSVKVRQNRNGQPAHRSTSHPALPNAILPQTRRRLDAHRPIKFRCDRLHVVQAMEVMLTLDPKYDPKLDASIPPDIIHSQLPQITVRQMHNNPNDCLLAFILAIFSAAQLGRALRDTEARRKQSCV